MKRRLLAMGLALLLVLTMVPTVWATETGDGTGPGIEQIDDGSGTTGPVTSTEDEDGVTDESEPEGPRYIITGTDGTGQTEYNSLKEAVLGVPSGATIQLTEDEEIAEEIAVNKTITLDLNGCTLTNTADPGKTTGADNWMAVFRVGSSGNLTIQDNGTGGAIVGKSDEGNGAAVIEVVEGSTLTLEGGTIRSNVSAGEKSGNGGGIFVSNGTLTVKGDAVITGNSATNGGGIYATENSTVNIEGGEISGNSATNGGGIYATGNSTVNIKDGTVSGNKATFAPVSWTDENITYWTSGGGGGVYLDGGTVNVSGGTIDGNTAAEGGGIYATGNSSVEISGGTISNNEATSDVLSNSSPAGGGGIAIVGGRDASDNVYRITLEMSGGTITGNTSKGAGGGIGIRRGFYQCKPEFTMTGGSVTDNTAESAEGGGIRIEGKGTINPTSEDITITGNKTNSTRDLGGGGIFVVNSGMTTIQNAVITNNTAGGLGGGVAACVHGEIVGMTTKGEHAI